MLERNLNYQYTRSVHEFYALSSDVLAIRVISAAGNILEIGKGAFSISDLEDSSFIELFVGGRIIRMDYSGTLPAVRIADIALIRPYLPCGGSGGGGGGSVVVTNTPLPVTVGNFPTGWATEAKQDLQIVQEIAIATAIGEQTNPTVSNPATNASVISYLRGILAQLATGLTNWTGLLNRIPASLTGLGNFKVSIQEGSLSVTGANDKVKGTPTVINHSAGLAWVSVLPANSNRNYLAIKNNGNQRIRVRYNGGNPETFLPQERMSIESNYIITSEIEIQSVVGVQPVDIIHG